MVKQALAYRSNGHSDRVRVRSMAEDPDRFWKEYEVERRVHVGCFPGPLCGEVTAGALLSPWLVEQLKVAVSRVWWKRSLRDNAGR